MAVIMTEALSRSRGSWDRGVVDVTLATRCIGASGWGHGPRARPPGRAARAAGLRAGARAALRPLDRLLLARHPPADLPGARPDGGRRLGPRHGGRAVGPGGHGGR